MPQRLTREEFQRWAETQRGRFERIAGEPVAMSPEPVQHIRLKTRVWAALDRAIRDIGLDCEALGDGVTIEVDADTDYEPDTVVNCGPRLPPDATAATNPVIVVEVLSPGTRPSIPARSSQTISGSPRSSTISSSVLAVRRSSITAARAMPSSRAR